MTKLPDGIHRKHIHDAHGGWIARFPAGMIVIGVALAASVFGLYGAESSRTAVAEGVTLTAQGPSRIRNGEFFEMRLTVETDAAISETVLEVEGDIWRDITINTFIPAAADEEGADGTFRFSFGPLEPGETLNVKVDGQVNPDIGAAVNAGQISVADGDQPLVELDYSMEVLP